MSSDANVRKLVAAHIEKRCLLGMKSLFEECKEKISASGQSWFGLPKSCAIVSFLRYLKKLGYHVKEEKGRLIFTFYDGMLGCDSEHQYSAARMVQFYREAFENNFTSFLKEMECYAFLKETSQVYFFLKDPTYVKRLEQMGYLVETKTDDEGICHIDIRLDPEILIEMGNEDFDVKKHYMENLVKFEKTEPLPPRKTAPIKLKNDF